MVGRELSLRLDVNGQLALAVAVHVHDVLLHILLSYDKKAIGGNVVKNLFRRLPRWLAHTAPGSHTQWCYGGGDCGFSYAALTCAHRDHRNWRHAHNLIGDSPSQEKPQTSPPPAPQHDEVGFLFPGHSNNFVGRLAGRHHRACAVPISWGT